VRVCDCSICRTRGALNHCVEASCFRLLTPLDDLSVDEWHTRVAKDYFGKTCGFSRFDGLALRHRPTPVAGLERPFVTGERPIGETQGWTKASLNRDTNSALSRGA
jgi:hypothetical protein